MALAPAYFPTQLPRQYRRRWGVSLPCSGWERVGPPRSRHQGHTLMPALLDIGSDPEGRGPSVGGRRAFGHWGRSATRVAALRRAVHQPPSLGGALSASRAAGGPILESASRLDAVSAYHGRTTATRRCPWRDNRSTGGPSAPVLSYWGRPPSRLLRPRWIETELSHDVLNPARVPL